MTAVAKVAAESPPEDTASRFLFLSDPRAVRMALASALGQLAISPVPVDARHRLELVLAEVLNNVVEHAYAGRGDGLIELTLRCGALGIRCEVTDSGRPMPDGGPPGHGPPAPSDAAGDLPEGGFGWPLIHALARDLAYRRDEDRNTLGFHVPYDRRQGPGRRPAESGCTSRRPT